MTNQKVRVIMVRMATDAINTNMVRKILGKDKKELYKCEECGYRYDEKEWAEKCESWCQEYKTCNVGIISHGYPPEELIKN